MLNPYPSATPHRGIALQIEASATWVNVVHLAELVGPSSVDERRTCSAVCFEASLFGVKAGKSINVTARPREGGCTAACLAANDLEDGNLVVLERIGAAGEINAPDPDTSPRRRARAVFVLCASIVVAPYTKRSGIVTAEVFHVEQLPVHRVAWRSSARLMWGKSPFGNTYFSMNGLPCEVSSPPGSVEVIP